MGIQKPYREIETGARAQGSVTRGIETKRKIWTTPSSDADCSLYTKEVQADAGQKKSLKTPDVKMENDQTPMLWESDAMQQS
jgi:hypothetical protein